MSAWHATLVRRALRFTDNIGEALLAAEVALAQQPTKPVDAMLSRDIFNKSAQSILNRALKEASKLSITARRELELAIKLTDPLDSARAIVDFIRRYRVGLANLLGTTNLAALLEGAREVASHIPVIPPPGIGMPVPPSLEPAEAVALVDELRKVTAVEREQRIYMLPGAQQEYVRAALRIEASPPGPPFVPVLPGGDEPGRIHFAIIEEAGRELSTKNVMTREQFDRLDAAARQKAFTVAGVDAEETLTTILDLLAENVKEGADYEAFRTKVLAAVDEGTFLSEAHIEVVFRTNIQAAFSDGQMIVVRHPFIRSGFPYASIEVIDDDRTRHNHLALMKFGIDGTNIYRIDDPVFLLFRAPWDYNCRCGFIVLTVRHAADLGLAEAKQWLATGKEPLPPAFVSMPPFQPPPGFRREGVPLSIRLSMEAIEAAFGMVGDEWHGPTAPAPGWVQVGRGAHGGLIWKKAGQQQTAPQQQQQPVFTEDETAAIEYYRDAGHEAINDVLRGTNARSGQVRGTAPDREFLLKTVVPALDAAIAKSVLQADVVAYRGAGQHVARDPGYTSVTTDPKVAERFAAKHGGKVEGIRLPKGSSALPIPGEESEFLLPRRSNA